MPEVEPEVLLPRLFFLIPSTMGPEVVITEAVIDAFNQEKKIEDMPNVSVKRYAETEKKYYLVMVRALGGAQALSANFSHPEGLKARDKPLEALLGKVMAGLLVDILSCYHWKG